MKGTPRRLARSLLPVIVLFAAGAVPAAPDRAENGERITISLEQAIDRAVHLSDDLRFAGRETEIAAARHLRERRRYFPSVSVSYATDTSVTPLSPDSRSRRLSAGVRQTLYDGGALVRGRRLQQAEIAIRRQELERIERAVRNEAWRSVIELQMSERRVVARTSALEAARRALRIAEEQLELGLITEREVIEARLARIELEESLRAAGLEYERTRFTLARLLGFPPDAEIEIAGGFSAEVAVTPLDAGPDELFAGATRRNPDVRRRRLELERARTRANAAERRFSPEVAATLEVSLAADTLPLRDPDLSVGIEMSWSTDTPVTAGLTAAAAGGGELRRGTRIGVEPIERTTTDLDRATARLEVERHSAEIEELESELRFSIARDIALLELAVDRRESALERRDLAALRLTIVETEASLGRTRPVDVLEAANAVLEAELGLLEAAFEASLRRRELESIAAAYREEI